MNVLNLSFIILCLVYGAFTASISEICDLSKCSGPLQYYKELECKPIYKSPDKCCPYKYDCDHLKQRSSEKCYINNNVYNIGEVLNPEDSGDSCFRCSCIKSFQGRAVITCVSLDYFYQPPPNSTCYYRRSAVECGPRELICLEKPEDRPTCDVGGHIYQDGDHFTPPSPESPKTCFCGPGYTGENVKPFCIEPKYNCRTVLYYNGDVLDKGAPIMLASSSTNCPSFLRRPSEADYIIKAKESDPAAVDNDMICEFGNLTMNYGDELNQVPFYPNDCLKCVCIVGPRVACQVTPKDQCNN